MERGGLYTSLALVRAWRGQWDEAAEAAEAAHQRLDSSELDPEYLVPLATLDAELALAHDDRAQALRIAAYCCHQHGLHVWPSLLWPLLDVAARAAAPQRLPWLVAEIHRQGARHPPCARPRHDRPRRHSRAGPLVRPRSAILGSFIPQLT